jgi:alkylation response protein AidB-like acyl-CoA dehydrogenase
VGELADALLHSWSASKPDSASQHDAQKSLSARTLGLLGDIGILGLTVPEAFGGAGAGLDEVVPLLRGLGAQDRSLAMTVGLHLGPGTRPLIAFGSAEQQGRWLPSIAEGHCLTSFGATEPNAGSDLSAITSTARRLGDRLSIRGEKLYVTNGGWAKLLTAYVRTPDQGGLRATRMVLLTPDDGYTVGPEEDKLGLRGSSTVSIHMDALDVPADRLLGEPATGQAQFEAAMCWGRTALAAASLGVLDHVVERTLDYCSTRRQGGRTLDQIGIVAEKLAILRARRHVIDRLVQRLVCAGDDLHFVSLAAKIATSEAAWDAADVATQLHGAIGYMEPTGLPLVLRDARPARIFEGANEVLLCRAGLAVVMKPELAGSISGPVRERWSAEHGIRLARDARRLYRLGRLWLEEQLSADLDDHPLSALWLHGQPDRTASFVREPADSSLYANALARS